MGNRVDALVLLALGLLAGFLLSQVMGEAAPRATPVYDCQYGDNAP